MGALGFFRLNKLEVAFIIIFSALVLTQIFAASSTFSATSSATSDYEVTVKVAGFPVTCYANITVDGKAASGIKGGESKVFRFDNGTAHTIAVEKYVYESVDTRYCCLVRTAAFSTASSYTFAYTPQFYLTINVIPKGILSLEGAGWYDEGSKATFERPPIDVYGATGTRYSLLSWTVDGIENRPPLVIMGSPHQVVATYQTSYFLTVESAYGNSTGSGWYDSGSLAIFNVTSPVPTGGVIDTLGVKYAFENWTGDSHASTPEATVVMDSPKKVTANWGVEYPLIYKFRGIVAAIVMASGIIGLRYSFRYGKAYPLPPSRPTPQKAYCKYCGAERPAEAPYCPKCGKKQSE